MHSIIDANDQLGSIHIFNALAMGLNNTYTVKVAFEDTTTQTLTNEAVYDEMLDRLILKADPAQIWLPSVISLTMEKKV